MNPRTSPTAEEPTVKFAKEFAATYPGVVYADARSFPTMIVGPNTMGEKFTPKHAVYDTETDTTRVTFDVVPYGPLPVDGAA
jgi:hypothetical protein